MYRKLFALFAIGLAVVVFISSASGQVNCTANAGVPPIVRVEGTAEPVGDFTLVCTGGTPTLVGQPADPRSAANPQVGLLASHIYETKVVPFWKL